MEKYFVQTLNHLPPVKWIGEDMREFFVLLGKIIADCPIKKSGYKITKTMVEDSINISRFDTEVCENWTDIFFHKPEYDWKKFLKEKHLSE